MDATKVFINCPFDNTFFPLLKCLLFTLIYIDLKPQISETSDSGEARLHKLKDLMKDSQFSIHDLSRVEALKAGDLPRFNMPFECGIDFGLKLSNEVAFHSKRFLILETERYRYQRFISDISGNDIKSHNNDPERMIKVVRDWFKTSFDNIPRHRETWLSYNEFEFDYESNLTADGYDPKDIEAFTFSDIIDFMTPWITKHKARGDAAENNQ